MRAATLLSLWLFSACLTRTNLGAEPGQDLVPPDAGEADGQAADPDPDGLRAFAQDMVGLWQGALPVRPEFAIPVEYEFSADSTYRWRPIDETWSEPGYYLITRRLASGLRYEGELKDGQRRTTATLHNIGILQGGEVLQFDLNYGGGSLLPFELTKAP